MELLRSKHQESSTPCKYFRVIKASRHSLAVNLHSIVEPTAQESRNRPLSRNALNLDTRSRPHFPTAKYQFGSNPPPSTSLYPYNSFRIISAISPTCTNSLAKDRLTRTHETYNRLPHHGEMIALDGSACAVLLPQKPLPSITPKVRAVVQEPFHALRIILLRLRPRIPGVLAHAVAGPDE